MLALVELDVVTHVVDFAYQEFELHFGLVLLVDLPEHLVAL